MWQPVSSDGPGRRMRGVLPIVSKKPSRMSDKDDSGSLWTWTGQPSARSGTLQEPTRASFRPASHLSRREARLSASHCSAIMVIAFSIRPGSANSSTALSTGTEKERMSRSEEHTSEPVTNAHLVCRLLLEKQKTTQDTTTH